MPTQRGGYAVIADLEIVVAEYGDNYDITIYDNENGGLVDLTVFNTITLVAKTSDLATQVLSVTLTQPAGTTGVARWTIANGDTDITAGTYSAQISMVDSGTTILRRTEYLTMTVLEKIVA